MSRTIVDSKSHKSYKGIAMEGFIARWYAKNTQNNMKQYKDWAELVSESISSNSKVLEVAPGPGYLSIELSKQGEYDVTGMDISKTMVEIEQSNAREAGVKATFVHGDASNMPFDDETFNFIICTSAFKNFTKPISALNEMYRVLKHDGKALIIDLRRDASKEGINEEIKKMNLSLIDTLFTKFTFYFLRRSAYAKNEFEELVSHTRFSKCKIPVSQIGMEIWLEK